MLAVLNQANLDPIIHFQPQTRDGFILSHKEVIFPFWN